MTLHELRQCALEYETWLTKWRDHLNEMCEPTEQDVDKYIQNGDGTVFDKHYLDESEGLWTCYAGVGAMLFNALWAAEKREYNNQKELQ